MEVIISNATEYSKIVQELTKISTDKAANSRIFLIGKIDKAIKASIIWAQRNNELCSPYIKEHAQELESSVIKDHIELYVNNFSKDLGGEGMAAIEFFLEKGRQAKMFPDFRDDTLTISY